MSQKQLLFLVFFFNANLQYEFGWLFPEFEQNISHELDFRQGRYPLHQRNRILNGVPLLDCNLSDLFSSSFTPEAFNAERVSHLLRHRSDVYVPPIDWSYTSRRCLVMEFIQ